MKKNYRAKCKKCGGTGVISIIPKDNKHLEWFKPCKCQVKKVKEDRHFRFNKLLNRNA